MRSLLVLGTLMTEGADERQIQQLGDHRGAFAGVLQRSDGRAGGRPVGPGPAGRAAARGRDHRRPHHLAGTTWAWAYPLTGISGHLGYLVVGAQREPSGEEQFLLRALAQQTGGALANRRLHAQELATAATLSALNERLRGSVGALRRSMDIHARLTAVAVSGEGREGIARAVHELTGLQVVVEDRHGNLQAWAGSPPPDPYPKDSPACRERLLARAKQEGRPIRDGARLLAIAHPQGDTLGVIVLVDPERRAGDQELMALEHGATVLAMELARVRSLAESELRLRRDLLDELLAGTDTESGLARASALGYDLQRPHRVVGVEGNGPAGERHPLDALTQAVRRAARDEPAGTLLATRGTEVVLLADAEPDWDSLRHAVLRELGGGRIRWASGSAATRSASSRAPTTRPSWHCGCPPWPSGTTVAIRFDDLASTGCSSAFPISARWSGSSSAGWASLEYDAQRGSELVRTLSHHLEHGGNYELTAKSLIVHRNTLKYRLQRIRQIGQVDLRDPEIWFNLHLATRAWNTLGVLRSG